MRSQLVKWGPKAACVGYPKNMLRVPSLSLPIKWVYQDSVQPLTFAAQPSLVLPAGGPRALSAQVTALRAGNCLS